MLTLLLLLIIPLSWPFIAKIIWHTDITVGEVFVNILIGVVVVTSGWAMGRYLEAADVQILNGEVTGKRSEKVSCSHSYSCNCTKNGCSTCYDHAYDVDWILDTTVGEVKIDRVNRRGTKEPPRFTQALPGDPVAQRSQYTNYIKAAPNSLFNHLENTRAVKQYEGQIPSYPSSIRDYHYVDRFIAHGVSVPDASNWNLELAHTLKRLGTTKQANSVIVVTKSPSTEFATALNAAWLGGKKNDVVVVIGAPEYPKIAWVRVLSWTKNELFKVQLRDALMDLKEVRREEVLHTLKHHIEKGFERRPMADFEYLKDEIELPTWAVVLLVILSLVASVGSSIWLTNVSLFGGESYGSRWTPMRRRRF